MHVADVTLFFAPHSGGVKRYLLAKHRHYQRQPGLRHSLLVPGARDGEIAPDIHTLASPRIPFGGGYRLPLWPARFRRALCELAPDLIEAGDPYQLAFAALDAADALGVPAVAFAHSDLPRLLAGRCGRLVGAAADRYLRSLYNRFDLVLAPSRAVAQRLADGGVERIVVQPLGVDGEVFHPARHDPALRAELGLPADTRLLIFAGRMAREKQIPLLLETFAALGARHHLLLVGGERRAALRANVTVLPYEQDGVRLARLLASADALVHAGVHETFGLIVLEAMACGRPVIGIRGGALAELIDADTGVLAERSDAIALGRAIAALYERDRQAMGRAARRRVEQTYAWSRTFAQQIERYLHLSRRRSPAASAPADAPGVP
jgi:alpha-1,6-mannosyltransferase